MTPAEWECTFEDDEREILVVLAEGQGANKRNGFWGDAQGHFEKPGSASTEFPGAHGDSPRNPYGPPTS